MIGVKRPEQQTPKRLSKPLETKMYLRAERVAPEEMSPILSEPGLVRASATQEALRVGETFAWFASQHAFFPTPAAQFGSCAVSSACDMVKATWREV